MSGETALETRIRRVLAVFDAATSNTESLNTLAEMAANLQASLDLLFVEDVELEQVAGLPFARQVNLRTGAVAPLASNELEAETRAAEARLRRWLATAATKRQIRWSIRTIRGQISDALPTTPEPADLLVLRHRSGWERPRATIPEPDSVARQAGHSVLLLDHRGPPPRGVAVLYRPGREGRSAVNLAARLAAAHRRPLDVLVPPTETIDSARDRILAALSPDAATPAPRLRFSRLAAEDDISHIAAQGGDRLLVLGADDPILRQAGAWDQLRRAARSLLLVR